MNFRFFGRSVEHRHVPDLLDQFCLAVSEYLIDQLLAFLTISGIDFYLYQFVMGQGVVDLGKHIFTEAMLANQDNRFEMMGTLPQELFLITVDGHLKKRAVMNSGNCNDFPNH